jgi:hypothetical protein
MTSLLFGFTGLGLIGKAVRLPPRHCVIFLPHTPYEIIILHTIHHINHLVTHCDTEDRADILEFILETLYLFRDVVYHAKEIEFLRG